MQHFYAENPESDLRFGDVITGFQTVVPQMHKVGDFDAMELAIKVWRPAYLVVLTPCCSVGKSSSGTKAISLAPLIPLIPNLAKNPYFLEDFTRINRKVPAEYRLPPQAWRMQTPEKRAEMIAAGDVFIYLDFFAYSPHPLLKEYPFQQGSNVGTYFVDFGSIYRMECNQIERGKPTPTKMKMLELSQSARSDLRDKMSFYFGRSPLEDLAGAA